MQPTPDALKAQREQKEKREAAMGSGVNAAEAKGTGEDDTEEIIARVSGNLIGSPFPELIELIGKFNGIHTDFLKKRLRVLELVVDGDRRWNLARGQMMDHENDEFRTVDVLVRQTVAPVLHENRLLRSILLDDAQVAEYRKNLLKTNGNVQEEIEGKERSNGKRNRRSSD